MADYNRNRGSYASDENWDKNQGHYVDDNNFRQPGNYNRGEYDLDKDGNTGHTGGYYGGTNYMGTSYMSGNYLQNPEYWNNQHREGFRGNYQQSNYQQGNYGHQQRPDYDRYQQGQQYGQMGQQQYGGQQYYNRNDEHRGRQDYQQYGQGNYGNRNRWPEDPSYGKTSHHGGGNQGQHAYFYGHVAGLGNDEYVRHDNEWDYQNRNRNWNDQRDERQRSSYQRSDYQRSDYNQRSDYRNRGEDRNWWDKTRDEVASWFGDEEAERRRRMDEMRTGGHKGKGPKEYRRSDDRIREDVCDRLSEDPYVDASDVEVRVENGEVTLNGTVDSRTSRRRVEDIIESISGVTHVQNNLRVGQPMTVGSSTIKSSAVQGDTNRTGNTTEGKQA